MQWDENDQEPWLGRMGSKAFKWWSEHDCPWYYHRDVAIEEMEKFRAMVIYRIFRRYYYKF